MNAGGTELFESKETELEELERKIKELTNRKKIILDNAKKEEADKKTKRKKEVEDAYNNFVKLLNAYEKDFGGGYKVSLTGSFSM